MAPFAFVLIAGRKLVNNFPLRRFLARRGRKAKPPSAPLCPMRADVDLRKRTHRSLLQTVPPARSAGARIRKNGYNLAARRPDSRAGLLTRPSAREAVNP